MSDKDLKELRAKLEIHLEESGEIRADLKWLKKAFWVLAGAGMSFNITLFVGIIVYLLNHR
jgi:hypothetical protein